MSEWWQHFNETFDRSYWWRSWHENHGGSPLTAVPNNCRIVAEDGDWGRTRLHVTVPDNEHYGTSFGLTFARMGDRVEPETLMFSYNFRLEPSEWHNAGGKLPGFGGTYRRAGWGNRRGHGFDGWSVRLKLNGNEDTFAIGFYAYHISPLMKNHFFWRKPDGNPWLLARGRWHNIKALCVLNTVEAPKVPNEAYPHCLCIPQHSHPARADGILKAWIDGEPVTYWNHETRTLHQQLDNLLFRTIPELKIQSFWFDVYLDGEQHPPQELRFDKIKFPFFSAQRIEDADTRAL